MRSALILLLLIAVPFTPAPAQAACGSPPRLDSESSQVDCCSQCSDGVCPCGCGSEEESSGGHSDRPEHHGRTAFCACQPDSPQIPEQVARPLPDLSRLAHIGEAAQDHARSHTALPIPRNAVSDRTTPHPGDRLPLLI